MRRAVLGLLALLAFSPVSRALEEPPRAPESEANAQPTPREQFDAILQEFNQELQAFSEAYQQAKTDVERAKVFQERYPYRQQVEATARLIAEAVSARAPELSPRLPHATVYQSRSGRPEDPWLGPDIGDYLREQGASGLRAAVVVPAGFVCDHVEVLYDLDVEAKQAAEAAGANFLRAPAVNDHPSFIRMLADVVAAHLRP